MSIWPEVGVHPGIPFLVYRDLPAVNSSILWKLKRYSPLHARYEMDHPGETTPDQFFGQVLHARILEPAAWDKRYIVRPECDRRTKGGKAIYEAFCSGKGECEEVLPGDFERVDQIERAFRSAVCSGLVEGGAHEICLVWIDPETGVRLKARCDCIQENPFAGDVIVDLKTTASARDEDFERSIYQYGYFMQAAIYRAGWEVLKGKTPEFTILALEKKAPFAWADFPLGPETMEAGRLAFRQALHDFIECQNSGHWPGYRKQVKKGEKGFFEMSAYHRGIEGVSRFQEHAESKYVSFPAPEDSDDEFDEFMKG